MTTDVTVKVLASEIKTSIDRLIQQFSDAGINKSESDLVTQKEKEILLAYLNCEYSNTLRKLTVQRKIHSTLNVTTGATGKSKSIKIEIRKKRIYVNRSIEEIQDVKLKEEKKHNAEKKVLMLKKKQNQTIKNNHNKKNKQVINQHVNQIIQSTQSEKFRKKLEITILQRQTEKEIHKKIEKEAQRLAEEARRMAKENSEKWAAEEEMNAVVETADYHITTSHYARVAEDENDAKIEGERRNRVRHNKLNKQKKSNKLFISKTDREETRSINRYGRNKHKISILQQEFNKPIQIIARNVTIGETIIVTELANKMAVKSSQVIKTMMKLGIIATINQIIDQNTAQLVAKEMGHKVILIKENELEEALINDRDVSKILESRAPVVTIMGHIDHGKTSLLDYIRSSKVAAGEAGYITQHIGAYYVETNNGIITFLDTPGHKAFTAMRSRGVQITDIVVLVVAADDGVMPQTIEAIQHAKAAKVPLVIAVNKIDKLETDRDRIKKELSQHGVIPEEWGGETQYVYVSAKTGIGINELLNAILLQAEILELTAMRCGMAVGVVIESYLDKGRGPVATILIKEGTLNTGDIILCGFEYGRIRAIKDQLGHLVTSAGPSIPVEILGLSNIPIAGDTAIVVRDEKKAREVALYRQKKFREAKLARQKKTNLENMFSKITHSKFFELNIVLKTDVQGSCEAIINALLELSTEKVKINIIGSGVGRITETDAILAAASNAIILSFNVRVDASARRIIEAENLDLRCCSVIYSLIDEVKKAMTGLLVPEYIQKIIGFAEIRNVFKIPKFGSIAGCIVTKGIIKRHNSIRILRNNVIIHEGKLDSLRHFKENVNEVHHGLECGIGVNNYNDIHIHDIIESFENIQNQNVIK
ncbi:Translation initiation factor IF-2 [Candidatus Ecksteinia adelgidicola]|nr:Translation initiation factor IF-2 [Candidatus Ecksteinia adelgidicola]